MAARYAGCATDSRQRLRSSTYCLNTELHTDCDVALHMQLVSAADVAVRFEDIVRFEARGCCLLMHAQVKALYQRHCVDPAAGPGSPTAASSRGATLSSRGITAGPSAQCEHLRPMTHTSGSSQVT
jgi:hypothetical protein